MKSWRDATSKQYSTYLRKWEIFALQNNVIVWNPEISHILEFFVTLLDQGCGYSAINTARSALSTIISVNNMPVGKHSLVKRFLRGVFNIKPSLPRYVHTWDVNIVLNFLKNMNSFDVISLRDLSYKLVTLIALCTGQRCQTLSVLKLSDMNIINGIVYFRVSELLKQSRPGVHLKPLELKPFPLDEKLCVVKSLEVYIHRTAHLRDSTENLFITYIKLDGRVSKDTIARWIKTVLSLSGIDISVFKAHSIRSASTSAASELGVPITDILSTARWSSDCTFARHYNKVVTGPQNMGDALLSANI